MAQSPPVEVLAKHGKSTFLVPNAADGSLYSFQMDEPVQRMPFDIRYMAHQSQGRMANGDWMVADQRSTVFVLDPETCAVLRGPRSPGFGPDAGGALYDDPDVTPEALQRGVLLNVVTYAVGFSDGTTMHDYGNVSWTQVLPQRRGPASRLIAALNAMVAAAAEAGTTVPFLAVKSPPVVFALLSPQGTLEAVTAEAFWGHLDTSAAGSGSGGGGGGGAGAGGGSVLIANIQGRLVATPVPAVQAGLPVVTADAVARMLPAGADGADGADGEAPEEAPSAAPTTSRDVATRRWLGELATVDAAATVRGAVYAVVPYVSDARTPAWFPTPAAADPLALPTAPATALDSDRNRSAAVWADGSVAGLVPAGAAVTVLVSATVAGTVVVAALLVWRRRSWAPGTGKGDAADSAAAPAAASPAGRKRRGGGRKRAGGRGPGGPSPTEASGGADGEGRTSDDDAEEFAAASDENRAANLPAPPASAPPAAIAADTAAAPAAAGSVSVDALGDGGAVVTVGRLTVDTTALLGTGSHGTAVFRGRFEGQRAVAVKRLVRTAVPVPEREVDLLLRVDDHEHIVRYFCSEWTDTFVFIGLRLCDWSLYDLVAAGAAGRALPTRTIADRALFLAPPGLEVRAPGEPTDVVPMVPLLRGMIDGLVHLHSHNVVHRDVKPHNVLASAEGRRLLVADFGLCRQLADGQASFGTEIGDAGTLGWAAPEALPREPGRGDSGVGGSGDGGDDGGSGAGGASGSGSGSVGRLRRTRAVDVFSAGCVLYYVLTHGRHPFGEGTVERLENIRTGRTDLSALADQPEACDLVARMIQPDPSLRPTMEAVLQHPFFWSADRRLRFLLEASDFLEAQDRKSSVVLALEDGGRAIVGTSWQARMDPIFNAELRRFRTYEGNSTLALLRAIRNKRNHYQDAPPELRAAWGPLPDGFLAYFTGRFPRLLMHTYNTLAAYPPTHENGVMRHYFAPGPGAPPPSPPGVAEAAP